MIVESKNPETIVLHAGPRSDFATGDVAVPIFQTASYEFRSTEHVGFELMQGREAGARFIDALKLFYHVANIGDARSLAIHPASTTHSQLSPADQIASGVTPGYVRLSVGI